MVRLTEDDSAKKVEDATERHMRLCTQNPNADKYKNAVQPRYDDLKDKSVKLKDAQKEVKGTKDSVKLFDKVLDIALRDLNGRAKEFDRNNAGSNTATLLFPGGNYYDIITLPDDEEPDVAHGIALKVLALGSSHELFPFADKIEKAVANCHTALANQEAAIKSMGNAKTAVSISKITLVRQYNANYFAAASDVDKTFAEKLFPQLSSSKKKNGNSDNTDQATKA